MEDKKEHQRTVHLIIECANAYQATAAIDEGLVIGLELKICRVYNRACQIQQCFNCQNYGHSTPPCIKPLACCYCAGAHISKKCKSKPAAKCAACGGNHEAYNRKCHEKKKEIVCITAACLLTADRYPIILSSTPPLDISYFSLGTTIPLPTNSTNATKKQPPKSIQNKNALQYSSAPKNQNTIPTTSETRAGINTRSQAGSKRHSSKMDSPENSQKERNKRRPTISKDARPPLAEKSINIQCVFGKTLGSKDPLPNTNISDKTLAQEILG